ncbi:MAG: hypothetical protein IT170_17625 [Bryobacterales bacterium]|jgi:hypothetical protein|nr:hypothetical protein [Bryobacterales bacterium]
MATFLIKRLRPFLQEKYKWSPIGGSLNPLKINDFLDDGEILADSVYHAWSLLREQARELRVGDLLVSENESVYLCTYSGFEEAVWLPPAGGEEARQGGKEPGQDAAEAQMAEPRMTESGD